MAGKEKSAVQRGNLIEPVFRSSIFQKILEKDARNDEFLTTIIVHGGEKSQISTLTELDHVPAWQKQKFKEKPEVLQTLAGERGPLIVVCPSLHRSLEDDSQGGWLTESKYGIARDLAGQLVRSGLDWRQKIHISFVKCDTDIKTGFLVGLNLAAYKFRMVYSGESPFAGIKLSGISAAHIEEAQHLSESILVARHLVNLPADRLNPTTYSQLIYDLFNKKSGMKIHKLDTAKLLEKGMGLIAAVGQASSETACLVHVSYRPSGNHKAPLAVVGKGITFDSGGLDIKPPAAMRTMKKDMGGSAAVVGLAYYVMQTQPAKAFDFYFALAENSIDGHSFRPGDILQSLNGKTVEIENTDAEGRLVLADAITYALQHKEKPRLLIDVATLTGAIKVGLGADIPGLFANNDKIADKLLQSAQKMGEPIWRMPLARRYRKMLHSHTADMMNSTTSGFAGAITAALFLSEFVEDTPWAHLDIYAWTDSPQGPFVESGGTGQAVQALIAAIKIL